MTRRYAPDYTYWDICVSGPDLEVCLKSTNPVENIPPGMASSQYRLLKSELEKQLRGKTDKEKARILRNWNLGFTYWDYYRQRYERGRGMRIDLALASPLLAERATGVFVDVAERGGEDGQGKGASDHAPVVVDLQD